MSKCKTSDDQMTFKTMHGKLVQTVQQHVSHDFFLDTQDM